METDRSGVTSTRRDRQINAAQLREGLQRLGLTASEAEAADLLTALGGAAAELATAASTATGAFPDNR